MDKEIKYQTAINLFIHEGQLLWSRYSAMLVVNTIFIGLIGFTYNKEFVIPELIRKALPVLGIILCFLWFQMTKRGFMWISFWVTKARKIEEDNKDKINPLIEGNEHRKSSGEPFNTRNSSYIVIGIFALIYSFIWFSSS